MKITINDQIIHISDEDRHAVFSHIQAFVLKEYEKLDHNWQFLLKPVARAILHKMEDSAKKKGAMKEQVLAFRPEKRSDYCVHLLKIMTGLLYEATRKFELSLTTSGERLTGFSYNLNNQSQTGGSVATDGYQWVRQDDGAQVSGCCLHASVSEHAPLCP